MKDTQSQGSAQGAQAQVSNQSRGTANQSQNQQQWDACILTSNGDAIYVRGDIVRAGDNAVFTDTTGEEHKVSWEDLWNNVQTVKCVNPKYGTEQAPSDKGEGGGFRDESLQGLGSTTKQAISNFTKPSSKKAASEVQEARQQQGQGR